MCVCVGGGGGERWLSTIIINKIPRKSVVFVSRPGTFHTPAKKKKKKKKKKTIKQKTPIQQHITRKVREFLQLFSIETVQWSNKWHILPV